ncbi:tetratricopeptide repeat protein [Pedosphaera parvula]|uniref:Tetratricopeptide TPR_2 repeat protein n=1 Tax=Pedosphaera parvula (strain Ellin514) TaxID=320771 RepID=B9XPD6_PEDPL|nr:tetratricopeptide repeat protein [Pedosphaera parvula]EEF58276.1 Tetratricopeptide TPR_2 repeat protein [Pedosphaera parvula Ellin514]
MDSEATQSTDLIKLVDWLHKNQKQLIGFVLAIAVIGGGIAFYVANKNRQEVKAGEALSELRPSRATPGTQAPSVPPDAYLKVANEHPGTSAGGQALLLAGGALFEAGKFKEAQAQFDRFLGEHGDSALASQARIGVAASLEAQGEDAQAAAKYQALISSQPNDSVIPQAKSALARLYEKQGKYADALRLYQELTKQGNNDSWSAEAGIQIEELLAKHPELRPVAPVAPTSPMIPKSLPVSTNFAKPANNTTNKP